MRIIKYGCVLLFVVFTVILLLNIENITLEPWNRGQRLEHVGHGVGNGQRVAIITDSTETIVVLNYDGELIHRLRAGNERRSFVSAEFVELDDDNNLFVLDKIFGGAFEDATERVLKFSPTGEFLGVIYSYTYKNTDFIIAGSKIRTIAFNNGYLYLTRLEHHGFYLTRVNTRQPEELPVYTLYEFPNAFRNLAQCRINTSTEHIIWTAHTGNILKFDYSGSLIDEVIATDRMYPFMTTSDNESNLIYTDINNSEIVFIDNQTGERTILFDQTMTENGFYYSIIYRNNSLYASFNGSDLRILQSDGTHIVFNSYSLSGSQFALQWVIFIIFIFSIALLSVLLVWGAVFLIRCEIRIVVKQIVIVVIFTVIGSIILFNVIIDEMRDQNIYSTLSELLSISDLLSATLDVSIITSLESRTQFEDEEYLALAEHIRNVISQLHFEGKQIYLLIWMQRDGILYSMFDLEYDWGIFYPFGNQEDSDNYIVFATGESRTHVISDSLGEWVSVSSAMFDDYGNVKAVLEIGFNLRTFAEGAPRILRQVTLIVISVASVFLLFAIALLLMIDAHKKNKSKSMFLAIMSHEIRTPLNVVLGIAELQLQEETLSERTKEAFGGICQAGYSLLNIINDILDFSKIEADKLELTQDKYDTASMLSDTAQFSIFRIGSKKIEFVLDVSETLPARLYGDELRVKQILSNLLLNAIKYTDKGYVKLSVSHTVQDENIVLSFIVEDTGCGMTPDDMKRLFTAYTRFNANATRLTQGTGLGLSIVKRLVVMMGGTINVKSELGKGSAFSVEIKQIAVDGAILGEELAGKLCDLTYIRSFRDKSIDITREPMPYGKVLIVDDIEVNVILVSEMLSPYKLSIDTALSGFEAIEKVEAGGKYDLIFMDYMMPHMDGMEATKQLRDSGYEGAIVALTANALVGNAEMFMNNGFNDFISKPVDIRILDATLNKFIRDRQFYASSPSL